MNLKNTPVRINLKQLERSPFSIAVDEVSAQGRVEYLAISARFWKSEEMVKTTTKLNFLIETERSEERRVGKECRP